MTKKQNGELVTKSFLKSELEAFGQKLKEEIVGEIAGMRDEVIKEIRDLREEFDAHQFSHQRINDELQGHDGCLRKLEQPAP